MKALILTVLLFTAAHLGAQTTRIDPFFSPNGGCTQAIVDTVGAARSTVLVEAYSFTSHKITSALIEAKRRGVDVRVILDGSNLTDKYSNLPDLIAAGVPTWIDSRFKIAHDKVMIIDNVIVITGSFNDSWGAETQNAENLLRITDPNLAAIYSSRWSQLQGLSSPYTR